MSFEVMKNATSKKGNNAGAGKIEDQMGEPLKAAILFSDELSAIKVKILQLGVLEQLQSGYSLRNTWWGLESLESKSLFDDLCREVAETDLLFVAISEAKEFPTETKARLDAVPWKNSGRGLAFVSVLGTEGEPTTACLQLDDYLRALAERAGADYFAFPYRVPTSAQIAFSKELQQGTATTPDLPAILKPLEWRPHGGIND